MKPEHRRIDWVQVKDRLRESQAGLEKALTVSPERLEAVYRERATHLAARLKRTHIETDGLRVLVFGLGNERFALDFSTLVELLPFTGCTPFPGAPAQMLGVINVQGEIRSVIDLSRLFGISPENLKTSSYVLLVRHEGRQTAFRVDRVEAIQSISKEMLTASMDSASSTASFLQGVTPDRIGILNMRAIFSHPVFSSVPSQKEALP